MGAQTLLDSRTPLASGWSRGAFALGYTGHPSSCWCGSSAGPLATNCGHAVNPDQIAAQVEGSVAYGFDTLQSQSSVANGRMVETNFDRYPIARLRQLPRIETVIAPTFDFWGGVGEPTICVVAPAILNAIFAATGKPVRNLPLKNHGLRIV